MLPISMLANRLISEMCSYCNCNNLLTREARLRTRCVDYDRKTKVFHFNFLSFDARRERYYMVLEKARDGNVVCLCVKEVGVEIS